MVVAGSDAPNFLGMPGSRRLRRRVVTSLEVAAVLARPSGVV
jgi:hypothetical protein